MAVSRRDGNGDALAGEKLSTAPVDKAGAAGLTAAWHRHPIGVQKKKAGRFGTKGGPWRHGVRRAANIRTAVCQNSAHHVPGPGTQAH